MCALIRAFAGIMSSSIRVAMSMCSITTTDAVGKRADWHVGTMIGDISVSSRAKSRNYSRLPLIATGGVIGPLLQVALAHRFTTDSAFWQRFPILSSQMACAGLISMLFFVNLIFLKEVNLSRLSVLAISEVKYTLRVTPRLHRYRVAVRHAKFRLVRHSRITRNAAMTRKSKHRLSATVGAMTPVSPLMNTVSRMLSLDKSVNPPMTVYSRLASRRSSVRRA
jgi:hypothetical protein